MNKEIQLTDGTTWIHDGAAIKRIHVKVSGWVKVTYEENDTEYDAHIPSHRIDTILGEVRYQSPHGRI